MVYNIDQIGSTTSDIFREYDVKWAVLFGSYAKGMATEKSDIDIVMDCDIHGMRFFGLLNKLTEKLGKDVDLFMTAQFEDNPEFLSNILSKGKVIYGRVTETV